MIASASREYINNFHSPGEAIRQAEREFAKDPHRLHQPGADPSELSSKTPHQRN
jgi:hypothetical protein